MKGLSTQTIDDGNFKKYLICNGDLEVGQLSVCARKYARRKKCFTI